MDPIVSHGKTWWLSTESSSQLCSAMCMYSSPTRMSWSPLRLDVRLAGEEILVRGTCCVAVDELAKLATLLHTMLAVEAAPAIRGKRGTGRVRFVYWLGRARYGGPVAIPRFSASQVTLSKKRKVHAQEEAGPARCCRRRAAACRAHAKVPRASGSPLRACSRPPGMCGGNR